MPSRTTLCLIETFDVKNMVDELRTHTTETDHIVELIMRLDEKGADR